MIPMKPKLQTTINVILTFSLTILLLVSVSSYTTVNRLTNDANWVQHTLEVKTEIATFLAILVAAESGARGYALTGEEMYLESYAAAIKNTNNLLDHLRELTADNPRQKHNLDTLAPLLIKSLDLTRQLVEFRRNHTLDLYQNYPIVSQGKATLDLIGVILAEMQTEEDHLLHQRKLETETSTQLINTILLLGALVSVLFICIMLIYANRDFAERKHLDEKLRDMNAELGLALENAQAASLSKSYFVANMSHEIRTPMNAILGLVYLLEQSNLPNDANDLVRKIRMAGRSLLSIINDILDFSKIDSGKLEIELAPFRLGDVLDNLATIMSANAGEKDIELIIAPPPSKTNLLRGDALRLEQVLINLTSNAIKFTERGHVELSIDVLVAEEKRVTLRFAIRDSGIGIPIDKQQEIFAPFSQAEDSTSRRYGGTGLGLTISRRLVTAMGGELQVNSVPGSGSEFWFILSFDREQDAWLAAPEMAKLDILIADDSPIARDVLSSIVDGLGWSSTMVNSGDAAIRHIQIKQAQPKLLREVLLLDYKMPGLDGLATAKQIRLTLKDADDPIIIMVTAFANKELLDHPDSDLVDAVLSKPVTPSTLYNAVARAIRVRQGGEDRIPSRHQPRLVGLRIQVVDDSEINREVAQRILVGEGAHVILAKDGQQAVNWLRDHPAGVDIVLMDVQMPIMNGYEATRQIRRVPALAELPVIALTAGVFMEQQELANAAGMTAFIAKPFDVDAAIALIIKLTGWQTSAVATDIDVVSSSNPDSPQNFPGLAIEEGLKRCIEPAIYQKYLRQFAEEYINVVQSIAQSDKAKAARLAHKLKGVADTLALKEVATLAGELDQILHTDQSPTDSLARLQAAIHTALESIANYAPQA